MAGGRKNKRLVSSCFFSTNADFCCSLILSSWFPLELSFSVYLYFVGVVFLVTFHRPDVLFIITVNAMQR